MVNKDSNINRMPPTASAQLTDFQCSSFSLTMYNVIWFGLTVPTILHSEQAKL